MVDEVEGVNLNAMAERVTAAEGGAVNLSIAQVKEVMRLTFTELAKLDVMQVGEILEKYRGAES